MKNIKQFYKKALSKGISLPNIISWACIYFSSILGKCWGTLILYIKAPLLGVKLGKGIKAHGRTGLIRWPGGYIEIGDNVAIVSSRSRATACSLAFPTRFRVFGEGAKIIIGENSQFNGTSITARTQEIIIGKNVMFGPNCIVVDSDFHAHWPAETRIIEPGYENDKPVKIGDNVWVGMGAMILKGVAIGENSIIGAGSIVVNDVPPNCVACGIPAKVIKIINNPN